MFLVLSLCFGLGLANIPGGLKDVGGKVVGGSEVIPNSIPYQAGLILTNNNNSNSFCGGTLIDSKTVLTAAHCLTNIKSVEVILGAHRIDVQEPTQIRMAASSYTVHEFWNPRNFRNDIALVHLPQHVPLNAFIKTVILANDQKENYVSENARVSGWGRNSDATTAISLILRETKMPVVSNDVCNASFMGLVTSDQICTSGMELKSSCNGDSGGPLVVNNTQIGIVSFGSIFGCQLGYPAVYTRVSKYIDWIILHK